MSNFTSTSANATATNAYPDIMMFNDNYTVMAARNERLQNLSMIMVNGSPMCKIDYIASIQIHSAQYFNIYRRYNNVHEIIVEDYRGEFHIFKDIPLRDIVSSLLCLPETEHSNMSVLNAHSYGHNTPIYTDNIINEPVSHIQDCYNGANINLQGILQGYKEACNYCKDLLSSNWLESHVINDVYGVYSDDLPPLIPLNEPTTPAENKVVIPIAMLSPIKVCADTMMFLDLLDTIAVTTDDNVNVVKDLNEAFIAASDEDCDEDCDDGFDEFIAEIVKIINRPIVKLEVSIPELSNPVTRSATDNKEMSMRHSDIKKQKRCLSTAEAATAATTSAEKAPAKKRKREPSPEADLVERKFYNLRKRNH